MAEAPVLAVCVDFGSTYTKALLVELPTGAVLAATERRTTIETDVLDGYTACLTELTAADLRVGNPASTEVLACSSAGGGLRIAVIGNEELITAEAGRRVALSSGGRVVSVHAAADAGAMPDAPDADVVLLTGGTDGGNREVVVRAAAELVAAGWRGPVVIAANVDARDELVAVLAAAGLPHVVAANVVPRIGELAPDSARAAVREVFLAHVIGGKHLSASPDFAAMVRGATPDVVLTGVEVLAGQVGDVVVVDVGGATTDVHSVVEQDPDTTRTDDGLSREVVAPSPVNRTVEGDLGMRWSAVSTVAAAERPDLAPAARRRRADPGFLPSTDADQAADEAIAQAAVSLAIRRHAGRARVVVGPAGRVVERTGTDLRQVGVVIGSGGALRHARDGAAGQVLNAALAADGDWQLPARARVLVDADYVLAAIGLLAASHPKAAAALAGGLTHRGVTDPLLSGPTQGGPAARSQHLALPSD